MSKKVVTFLVVLFAITALGILVAKRDSKPVDTPAQQETAAASATDSAAKTEDKPATDADKENSLLGNGSDAGEAPKIAATPEAEKKPQPLTADMNGNISTPRRKSPSRPHLTKRKKPSPSSKTQAAACWLLPVARH